MKSLRTLTIAAALLLVASGCAELPQPTAPSSGCAAALGLDPFTVSISAEGGRGLVNVTEAAGCTWTASVDSAWISIVSATTGTGAGVLEYTIAANLSQAPRSGTIAVADRRVVVSQGGAQCAVVLGTREIVAGQQGGRFAVTVSGDAGCAWNALSSAGWIAIVDGGEGQGNGRVTLAVSPNESGAARSGGVVIAGQTVTVLQAGMCAYTLSPPGQGVGAAAGQTTFAVATEPACGWNASTDIEWLTVTSGRSGTGPGSVTVAFTENSGIERSATVTVADAVFTVRQSGACATTIAPASQAYAVGGAAGSVTVTAGAGCAWTAVSNAAWITVTAGSSGTGDGSVSLTVAANTGPARSGTVTIAGETYTVAQASGCSFGIAPASQANAVGGGSSSVNVTAGGGCTWTAVSNAAWITVTAGSSGIGDGSVSLTVAANTGPARSGTVTIAAETYTVTQADGCSFALGSVSQAFTVIGGPGTVSVTAGGGCAWTAVSNAAWITITSGSSGTGDGTVSFTVALNAGIVPRTGTITVAGQTFTVTQGI